MCTLLTDPTPPVHQCLSLSVPIGGDALPVNVATPCIFAILLSIKPWLLAVSWRVLSVSDNASLKEPLKILPDNPTGSKNTIVIAPAMWGT